MYDMTLESYNYICINTKCHICIFRESAQSPTTPTTPAVAVQQSVGGEMLARSPMGSVGDLSLLSDTEATPAGIRRSNRRF